MTTTNNLCSTFTVLKRISQDQRNQIKPFEFLVNNPKFSDIQFIIGRDNQQRISAHKLILAARSAVFEAMFYGTLATKSDEIQIPDIEPSAFLSLLNFLYTNEVQISPKTVLAILYAANKYDVPASESLLDEPQLVALCLDLINKNTMDVLEADSFTDVDLGTLIFMLERDTLQVFESKLFQAIVLWSEAECARKQLPITPENQRSVLGQALELIRFPLMTLKEFVIGPVKSGLLDGSEITKFCVDTASNASSTEIPRCIKNPIECHFKFDSSNDTLSRYDTSFEDELKFIRPVVIIGFVLCPIIIKYKTNVLLTLKDVTEDTVRCCVSQRNNSACPQDLLRIIFNKPIMVIPDNNYKVVIEIEERSGDTQIRKKSDGIICGYDGKKLENLNPTDYFSFKCWTGIISQIIFYVSQEMK
ncbi:BTB/POZ domain-containing protein 2-like [Chrysoperla carnea]|uniref:BTB/POZ domain-containing protein 2-like n=1 Tax=Chrysoperla carnea TaxID=189513 RepID=UPI001D095999|nr:BTB/POZ domain-containing protein 2-like [Chrysoperla carnea]